MKHTKPQTKTATLLRDNLPDYAGYAALYRLEPPMIYGDDEESSISHVVVSAVRTSWAHETYIFRADRNGKATKWGELPGSVKGTTSHAEALERAGYTIKD